jgi:hypothetical protein
MSSHGGQPISEKGEGQMKHWTDIMKNISMLTQFGLSLVTPLLLCLALCWWLNTHVGLGGWIYIAGFFFGLGGSGMVAYKLYQQITRQQKKGKKNNKVSFNRHF